MATQQQLIARVDRIIQDDSFTDSDILEFLNEGYRKIAYGIRMPEGGITSPLPALVTTGTVTALTDSSSVALPADYCRELFHVVNTANNMPVTILENLDVFLRSYPAEDVVSSVYVVAVSGGTLKYQGIPTAEEDLTLYYYKTATEMEDATDTPSALPEHLHMDLLSNYAGWQILELIHDGMDGPTPATLSRKNAFFEALINLNEYIWHNREPIQMLATEHGY